MSVNGCSATAGPAEAEGAEAPARRASRPCRVPCALMDPRRIVSLEGARNFRDLGGYRTADGGRTRWGLVFRSDALHRLTVEDVAAVGRLGLRVVYDLRRDVEGERMPSVELPDGDVRRVILAIGGAAGETGEITDQIFSGEFEATTD